MLFRELCPWYKNVYLPWGLIVELTRDKIFAELKEYFKLLDEWSDELTDNAISKIQLAIFRTRIDHYTRYTLSDSVAQSTSEIAQIIYDAYKKWYSQQKYEALLNLDNGLQDLFKTTKVICGMKNEDFSRLFSEKVSGKTNNKSTRTPNLTTETSGTNVNDGSNTDAVLQASGSPTDKPIEEIRNNRHLAGGTTAESKDTLTSENTSKLTGDDLNESESTTSGTRDVDKDTYIKNIGDSQTNTEDAFKVQFLKELYEGTQAVQHSMKTFIQNTFAFILQPIQDAEYVPMPFPWIYT